MLGPLDEFPIHQTAQPVGLPATSDRNFYDRSYFNLLDREGDTMLITGIGYYPRLGVKDAYVLIRQENSQTALHLSDAIDANRLDQRVGAYRVEVVEPLHKLRIVLEETEGIAMDVTWEGLFPAVREHPHVMTSARRVTLDACRFAQVGAWSGTVEVDGESIAVTPDRWMGSRDRSWGIRPIGEAEPAGRPEDPPFEGMWWLYLPIAFEDNWIMIIVQEEPTGIRTMFDCTRFWRDGRVDPLTTVDATIDYRPGTRIPTGAHVDVVTRSGERLTLEVESRQFAPIALGGGYGGDSQWAHGSWKGEGFTERVTHDMTDPAVLATTPFSMIDHSGHFVLTDGDGVRHEGHGLFEHGALGRHDPSGFSDWFTLAP
ncbi:DUF7064 domain-containing protein [Gordonia soli]|uniref:DUF7064 domain-containing protein n=1 Tax=Gordonia soli NBRC 108243 TaxID=1223545 RepID=M0QMR8_9ACTN|nr:hypothetical protein [Gordonia soli]GAC69848.1 hypothetical protein GS4_28_00960 [Gordonia soli NBRC 108243]